MGWLEEYQNANPNFNFGYAQQYAQQGSYRDPESGWTSYAKPPGYDEFHTAYQDYYKRMSAPQSVQPLQPQVATPIQPGVMMGQLAGLTGSQPQSQPQSGLDMSLLAGLTNYNTQQDNTAGFGPAFGGNYNKIGAGIGDLALLTR